MKRLLLAAALFVLPLTAQTPAPNATPNSTSRNSTAKPNPFQPKAQQAPGAGPDKVWVNNKTNVYHCPGDRYYGKTSDGHYAPEPEAKKAGAHGARNQTCFK